MNHRHVLFQFLSVPFACLLCFMCQAQAPVKIMGLGDSITEGGAYFTSYLIPLKDMVDKAGWNATFIGPKECSGAGDNIIRTAGFSGKTVEYLDSVIDTLYRRYPADVVLLHAAHNHFAEEKPIQGILASYRSIIAKIRTVNPNAYVLLAQVVHSGKLPKYSYIPKLNKKIRALVHSLNDPRVILVDASKGFRWEEHTVKDKVHPNQAGAAVIAQNFFSILEQIPALVKGEMVSPGGIVRARLLLDKEALSYSVAFNGDNVIFPSSLGIILGRDTIGLNADVRFVGSKEFDETYPTRGVHSMAINKSTQYEFTIEEKGHEIGLQFRLFDDGLAYRYIWDEPDTTKIGGEMSSFQVPSGIPVWFFERPNDWKLKTYAGIWTKTMSDSLWRISPGGPVQGAPLVFELPAGGYMVLSEAALYHYSGMRYRAYPDAFLRADFTEGSGGFVVDKKGSTPWRVIILSEDLDGIVSSDIITNLNPPSDLLEKEIPEGGTCAWSWWSDSSSPEDPEREHKVIDCAAELGCRWSLIDEGWEKWPDKWETLRKICKHANDNRIGIFVWKHYRQVADTTSNYRQLSMFLDSLSSVGASGIKVDYFNGETKSLVDLQEAILIETSKRGLLVDFHGCQKPTGESRRYPNEMTREGIRGLELNKMGDHLSANHNVALVFTRCLLGNADYTPIGFSNPGPTTWTHQLASAFAFTSPMTVLAENPEKLLTEPAYAPALPFIKDMPTCWDETKVLPSSEISSKAILARRKGNVWYLVALCGNVGASVEVPLSFLGHGTWIGKGLVDSDDRSFAPCTGFFTAEESLRIDMLDGGGTIWRFERNN